MFFLARRQNLGSELRRRGSRIGAPSGAPDARGSGQPARQSLRVPLPQWGDAAAWHQVLEQRCCHWGFFAVVFKRLGC